jgi:hypothetical protein
MEREVKNSLINCEQNILKNTELLGSNQKGEQLGRGPPEGRFLYFPKLFPVRWFFGRWRPLRPWGYYRQVR